MKTVSCLYLESFYLSCLDLGLSEAEMLPLIPGGKAALAQTDTRFPAACVMELLRTAEKIAGNKAIGLNVGKNLRPADFADVGHAISFCATLRDAILINTRYQPLTQQLGYSTLDVRDGQAFLRWNMDGDPEVCRHVTESVLASHSQFGRWLIWQYSDAMDSVYFRHPKPDYADKYTDLFECPIHYDQPYDALVFAQEALGYELPQADAQMLSETCARLDMKMLTLDKDGVLTHRLSQLLEIVLPSGDIDSKAIAKKIGMSERSLRRRLNAEGASYRDLLSETRQRLCKHYMHDGAMTLRDMATRLAYSEQSAFTRAFRSWHGVSPFQYAKANGIDLPRAEAE